eukprot:4312598-Pleurochrysis_carterae.AAC.1
MAVRMAVTRAATTNTHRNNSSGFVQVQAVATPALHHHSLFVVTFIISALIKSISWRGRIGWDLLRSARVDRR